MNKSKYRCQFGNLIWYQQLVKSKTTCDRKSSIYLSISVAFCYSLKKNSNCRIIISNHEKKRNDYWDCIKKEKKSIGEYPFKSRNNTSKKFKAMSLNEKVKHTQRKIRNLRTKYKKEIDIYNKKTKRMYKKCNKVYNVGKND